MSEPWSIFAGDKDQYEKPKTPAKRVPTNVSRFAGNYINLIFCSGVLMTLIGDRSASIVVLIILQAVALLANSIAEVFGHTLPSGDEAMENWIRFAVAALSHLGLWVIPLRSS